MAFARGDTNLAIAKQAALDDLTSAEQMKAKGNDDLMKGKMLVGHRAGEELLTSACKWYAKALEIVPLSRSLTEHGEEILARKKSFAHQSAAELGAGEHTLRRVGYGAELHRHDP